MGKLSCYIGSQFGNPRGVAGKICCFIMNRINKKMYYSVTEKLSNEKRILDIGYGNGYLIQKMYKKTRAKIDGIDISEDMKAAAGRQNRDGIRRGDIRLYIGDCCSLDFEERSFEAVTAVNSIYFWEDTELGLREIHRVLAEGGVFYNAVYSKEWLTRISYTKEGFKIYTKEEYMAMAKKSGFSSVWTVDIIKGKNYLVICKK